MTSSSTPTTYRILLLESFYPIMGELNVGQITKVKCPDRSLRTLKELTQFRCLASMDEQHWFTGHLTLEEVKHATPLKEDAQFTSSDTNKLTLVIKSPLSAALIEVRVPHLNVMGRGLLLKRLQLIPIDQLDVNSLRETQVNSQSPEVAIRNYTTNTFTNHIIIDEEEYIPHQVDEKTKMVTLRYRYPYRYSVASADYAKEVNEVCV